MLEVVFQVGDERFGLLSALVREILPLLALEQLPRSPPYFAGLLRHRGRLIPVLDLKALHQDQPSARRMSTRIILVDHDGASGRGELLGLLAEWVTGATRGEGSTSASGWTSLNRLAELIPPDVGARLFVTRDAD